MSRAVTVAIPVYNGARFLAKTIESLLAQTHPELAIVVLDDGSTDASLEIARSFRDERLSVIANESRRGLARNWNLAFEIAETPYLVIAHQDDVYDPRYVEIAAQLLDEHPRAFIAHTRAQYIDEHERPATNAASRFKDAFWPNDEPYEREPAAELRALQRGNYIIAPSAIYRMNAVRQIGAFNERYHFVPDWEYWIRGVLAGFTIAGTHRRLVQWRRHDATATAQEESTLRRYDEELALLRWMAGAAHLPVHLGAAENSLLSQFAERLARGDRAGAAALHRYARERLPQSRRSHLLMRVSAIGGPLAGRALKVAEAIYARFARPARIQPDA